MKTNVLSNSWFEIWENGNFEDLPISEDFIHESPFGIIEGKETYLNIVRQNKSKFLGHVFYVHDSLNSVDRSCFRYRTVKEQFQMEVSEWHYYEGSFIKKIVSYYNLADKIPADRKLKYGNS